MQSPILLVGMHRSGTSMLTRMLARLGLFVGKRVDGNEESTFFQSLNEWALRSAGGSWERPHAIHALLKKPELRALTTDYLRGMLRSPRVASYLGVASYLRHRTPEALPGPWGFKDPRTTFTLPLWLDLFPDARVVHVRRHGVDVAQSLLVRQEKDLDRAGALHRRRRGVYWLRPKRGGFAHTVRALSIEEGFGLWDEYLVEADRRLAELGDCGLDLRYEAFLDAPEESLARVAAFCGLTPSPEELRAVAAGVQRGRANAWSGEPELVAFAGEVGPKLEAHGYVAAPPRGEPR